MREITYIDYINKNADERLDYFMETLSITNRTPDYYVNWEKVTRETGKYELELNTLNYLIGKDDIYRETLELFKKQPDLIRALPSLIASRDKILDVLNIDKEDNMDFYKLDFENIDVNNIESYVDFTEESGLLNFLQNEAKRSLVDYVYGVEAGLDSNARKNRSGSTMEKILNRNIIKASKKFKIEHQSQATAEFIRSNWGIDIQVDKAARRFDEAVYCREKNSLWLIETNYYGGGGSKLKATAGEFIMLNNLISEPEKNINFAWVTDGQGWHTAKAPLLEAFGHIKYVFNLKMLKDGYLEELLK